MNINEKSKLLNIKLSIPAFKRSMKKTNILTLSHDYQIDKSQVLGKGSTGEVYLGKQLTTGLPVAVKLIRLETIDNEVTEYLLKMEKIALTSLSHENILKGLKVIENASKCYMITEYCNGGTLKQLIKRQGTLSEQKSLEILKGLLRGYSLLARKKIVHRDLKPANIMLHNMVPKIIDFGYCEIQGYEKPSLQYNVGSPSYMAPESFEQNIYNEKTQIWAIGIILFQCLMGKTFDDGKHMSEVFKAMKKFGIPFGRQVSDKCRKIISWCLEFSPEKRPTALELIDFLVEKKPNEPQFFILDKNRKKINSLYTSAIPFESSNMLTKRKTFVGEKKVSSIYQPEQKLTEIQGQTLRRKISIKESPKVIMEEVQGKSSRSNSKSKEKFGRIVQQSGHRKVESINFPSRERVTSNYSVRNEYGLNREPAFKTEKYFTGQNVQNKIPVHQISAFNSGLTSPRELQRKETQTTLVSTMTDKNPESFKQRVSSKVSNSNGSPSAQTYFEFNPSATYRYSLNVDQKAPILTKLPLRKQNNMPSTHIQKEPMIFSTRHPSQYAQMKSAVVKQPGQFLQSYQSGGAQFSQRDRPSSSIYQLNKFMDEREKAISIFRSGVEMGQKTCR